MNVCDVTAMYRRVQMSEHRKAIAPQPNATLLLRAEKEPITGRLSSMKLLILCRAEVESEIGFVSETFVAFFAILPALALWVLQRFEMENGYLICHRAIPGEMGECFLH